MRRKVVWTATATMVMGILGYWVLSGFSIGGTMTYDLMASGPSPDRTQSWRFKAGQALLSLLYSHDTQYGALYREEAFRAVKPGATEDEIRTALGEPFYERRLDGGRSIWHYTKPGPKTQDFLVRIVEFDAARRVARTRAEFYVD